MNLKKEFLIGDSSSQLHVACSKNGAGIFWSLTYRAAADDTDDEWPMWAVI